MGSLGSSLITELPRALKWKIDKIQNIGYSKFEIDCHSIQLFLIAHLNVTNINA